MTLARLTVGTAQLGMPYGIANAAGMPDDAVATSIVDGAFALSSTSPPSFDTAPAYGVAEERLGSLLRRRPCTITTKVPSLQHASVADADVASFVEASCRRSLARLGVARVDHALLHDASDLERYGRRLVDALARLVEQGLATSVGVSTYAPAQVESAARFPELSSLQVPLNLLDQRLRAGALEHAASRGMTVFARSGYLQGLFSLDPESLPERVAHCAGALRTLRDVCASFGTTPVEVALAWVASVPGVSSVVVGVETAAQLRESEARLHVAVPSGLDEALRLAFASVDQRIIDPSKWGKA